MIHAFDSKGFFPFAKFRFDLHRREANAPEGFSPNARGLGVSLLATKIKYILRWTIALTLL